ncbi:MAG: hypothetical protein SCL54_10625 [Bacillota bacterium]|nr:hypothetical protein [Bacillota bacterium]
MSRSKNLKKILSLTLIIVMTVGNVLPAFAQPRTVYDPLAILDLLKEDNLAPTVPNPLGNMSIQMPELPDVAQSPNSLGKPTEQITGPNTTEAHPSLVDLKTGNLVFEENDI